MRATCFISGLILTTSVLAAPTPYNGKEDLQDANPFNVDRRALGGLPVDVPSTDAVTSVVDGVLKTLPVVNGLKVPVRRELPALPGLPELPSLPVDLPTDSLVDELQKAANGLPIKLPALPVRRGLTDGLDATLNPILSALNKPLNAMLASLTSADAHVRKLIANLESNTTGVVASIEAELNATLSQFQGLAAQLEGKDASSLAPVQGLVKQVEGTAAQLVADLQAVQGDVPDMPHLINIAQGIVETVGALGL